MTSKADLLGGVITVVESVEFDDLADDVLDSVASKVLDEYNAKISAGLQDLIADATESFGRMLSKEVSAACGWRPPDRTFVLPRNCRFCFRKGASTLIVVESDPQVRTMNFDGTLTESGAPESWPLAIPYTVFVVHLYGGRFQQLFCGWRTSPLRSIHDQIYSPVLTNVCDNLSVCLGEFELAEGVDPCVATDAVISRFWESTFTQDLHAVWYNKGGLDPRLVTLRSWAEASEKDPLFVLGLALPQGCDKTLESLVESVTCGEWVADEETMKGLTEAAVEALSRRLEARIMRQLSGVVLDRYRPKDVRRKLASAFAEVHSDLSDVLAGMREELSKLAKPKKPAKRVRKAGPMWDRC